MIRLRLKRLESFEELLPKFLLLVEKFLLGKFHFVDGAHIESSVLNYANSIIVHCNSAERGYP